MTERLRGAGIVALALAIVAVGAATAGAQVTYTRTGFTAGMTPIYSDPGATVVFDGSSGTFDDQERDVGIGFTFNFFGNPYTQVTVGTNGYLTFGSYGSDFSNDSIPSVNAPNNYIALFWDDLKVYNNGGVPDQVWTKLEGSAPNRVFVVEYRSVSVYSDPDAYVYGQVRLYEGTDEVELHYYAVQNWTSAISATIGIENDTGSIGYGGPGTGNANSSVPTENYRFTPSGGGPSGQPDLTVGTVTASTYTAAPGDYLSVTREFSNIGGAAAGAFRYGIYLSTNTTITNYADTLIYDYSPSGLSAGGTNGPATISVQVPTSLAPGTYYVGVIVDDQDQVQEADEWNNTGHDPTPLVVGGNDPDLVADSVTLGGYTVTAGDTLQVTREVSNIGPVDVSSFQYGVYLSTNNVISTGDTSLYTGIRSQAAGTSNQMTLSVTIPATTAPGDYYVGIILDDNDQIVELSETNNTAYDATPVHVDAAVTAQPDLVANSVTLGSYTVQPGDSLQVDRSFGNVGGAAANGFRYGVYLSTNSTISTADTLIYDYTWSTLVAGGSSSGPITLTVPPATPAGDYYVGIYVDDLSAVAESDETNNTAYDATRLTVGTAATPADLVVSNVAAQSAQVTAGGTLQVARTLANNGGTQAGSFVYKVYLSTNSTITTGDTAVYQQTVGSLAAGASDSATVSVSVPSSLAPGTYYVGAIVDTGGAVTESNESNNDGVDTSPIQVVPATTPDPDLTVTSVALGSHSVDAGDSVNVTYAYQNVGQSSAGGFHAGIYLSADPTITTADTLLGGFSPTGMNAGASSGPQTTQVTIPAGTAAGSYYVGLIVDDASVITELSESNNTGYDQTPLVVTVPSNPQVDLAVQTVSISAYTAQVGDIIDVTHTFTNAGTAAAGAFHCGIYLSVDQTIDSGDTLVFDFTPSSLAAGAQSGPQTDRVTILWTVPAGTYYVGLLVDDNDQVTESDETNNSGHDATPLVVSGGSGPSTGADLTVAGVSLTNASVQAGNTIDVVRSIANIGTADAATFRYGVYLSADALIDAQDVLLNSFNLAGLAAGASDGPASITVTVPAGTADGAYYVGVIVDDTNIVSETVETNNAAAASAVLAVGSGSTTPATQVTRSSSGGGGGGCALAEEGQSSPFALLALLLALAVLGRGCVRD